MQPDENQRNQNFVQPDEQFLFVQPAEILNCVTFVKIDGRVPPRLRLGSSRCARPVSSALRILPRILRPSALIRPGTDSASQIIVALVTQLCYTIRVDLCIKKGDNHEKQRFSRGLFIYGRIARYTAVFTKWETGSDHVYRILEADRPYITKSDYRFLVSRLFLDAIESYEYNDIRVDVFGGFNMGKSSDPVLSVSCLTFYDGLTIDADIWIGDTFIRRMSIAEQGGDYLYGSIRAVPD